MKHWHRFKDLTDMRFGRLVAIKRISPVGQKNVKWLCVCDCGKEVEAFTTYLRNSDTRSCGCLKREIEPINLREEYENKRIDGVVRPLFKGREPRRDSGTGYRGVQRYHTRVSNEERYRAIITVKGKIYKRAGFLTAESAYYDSGGRLDLERKHLPKWSEDDEDK